MSMRNAWFAEQKGHTQTHMDVMSRILNEVSFPVDLFFPSGVLKPLYFLHQNASILTLT